MTKLMGDEIPTVDIDEEQRPTIAFRPTNLRQKAEWERAAANSDEYANTSHLIRTAVKREIARDPQEARESRQTAVGGQQLGEVTDTLENFQTRIGDLEQAVSDATRAMNMEGGGLSDETLGEVYAAVPEGSLSEATEKGATPEEIAERVDLDGYTVKVALEQLAEGGSAVYHWNIGEEGRSVDYYKKVGNL